VASFIIVNEFCERLAYYGFAGSLVLFFQTKMGMSNAEADIQVSVRILLFSIRWLFHRTCSYTWYVCMGMCIYHQYSAWNGACYLTPLLGGYVADKYLGRSKTIISFSLIYLLGLVFVVLCATPDFGYASPLMFVAIYVVALGTGGIKPNVSTLGADQFDERYEQDRVEKASFFNW
jgi:peptide/histidine transporter 3/4